MIIFDKMFFLYLFNFFFLWDTFFYKNKISVPVIPSPYLSCDSLPPRHVHPIRIWWFIKYGRIDEERELYIFGVVNLERIHVDDDCKCLILCDCGFWIYNSFFILLFFFLCEDAKNEFYTACWWMMMLLKIKKCLCVFG